MTPLERTWNPRQMDECARRQIYGRVQPMEEPTWLERLFERKKR